MADSTSRRSGGKAARPRKPRKDFPLYPHRAGYWAKKVRGRTLYFGRVADDPRGKAALEQWLEQKDDLLAGRQPRVAKDEDLSVGDLCNRFLTHKAGLRDHGELSPRTFRDYYDTCANLVACLGRNAAAPGLTPDDFGGLRVYLAKRMGAVALRNEMGRVGSVFKYAFDQGLVSAPVRFGPSFKRPKLDVVRREREAHRAEHGPRMFEAHEIRAILDAGDQPMRTMVLLAINGGLGQTDLGRLPMRAVNLKTGWLDYGRPKTGVSRRIPLWPETVASIREWVPMRPKAKDKADAGLLFLTPRGARWVTVSRNGAPRDAVAQHFTKLLRNLGLHRPRLGFYGLRHSFETVAGELADQVAVDAIMGHIPQGMGAHYRERISDDRLRAVVDCVRAWVFAEAPGDPASRDNDGEHVETAEQTTTEPGAPRLRLYAG